MDRRTWCFVLGALLLSAALAAFVSPFASSAPDGLDKLAEEQQFAERAEGKAARLHAPLAQYKVCGVQNGAVSTALAGAAGTLFVFACGWGLSKAVARRKSGNRG